MAFLDNSLAFSSSWSTGQAVTTTADSTNVVDITGAGSGNAPAMINGFPALNTAIGSDYGAGDGLFVPYLYITVTVAGTGSGTITITLNAAPDNGSYGQGSYYQLYESAAFVGTTLKKGSVLIVPVPPVPNNANDASGGIDDVLPRFYKLTYTVSGSATATFIAGLATNVPESLLAIQYNNNFTVV